MQYMYYFVEVIAVLLIIVFGQYAFEKWFKNDKIPYGGSAIDTAKAIAHGTANVDKDLWDIWTKKVPLTNSLPVGAVLTIAAAGSEMSDSAVWGAWAKELYKGALTRFAGFAEKVWEIDGTDEENVALSGIIKTIDFFKNIGKSHLRLCWCGIF